jgi:hypothetical protein
MRSEVLPVYYGENIFVIHTPYNSAANNVPKWLISLSTSSVNLIKTLELSADDLSAAVIMMAHQGFKITKYFCNDNGTVKLHFTASARSIQAYELKLPEVKAVPSLSFSLLSEGQAVAGADTDDTGSVGTDILDEDGYSGVVEEGVFATVTTGQAVNFPTWYSVREDMLRAVESE